MKKYLIIGISIAVLVASGCRDREEEIRKAKEDTDAKTRAETARKEMDALPKTFKSRDYFKKNEPDKKPDAPATEQKPNP